MHKTLGLILFFSFHVFAQEACPQLQGTFRCRAQPEFDIAITQEFQNGSPAYTMTDPNDTRTFVVNGQWREMQIQGGAAQYRAQCYGDNLIVEINSAKGAITDRYYIQRAALVRIRLGQSQPSSLSCRPTHGTWHRYRH